MSKNDLEKELTSATDSLLKMARELCWNNINDNCLYIISEIYHSGLPLVQRIRQKKKENKKKKAASLATLMPILLQLYPDFYDINLFIWNAKKNSTIIEIQYFPKSSLDPDHRENVRNNDPMLHCKVPFPPYREENKKIDINWHLENFRFKWDMFLLKCRLRTNN
jgi:hypothetical protein